MSRRSSLASLLLERLEGEEENKKKSSFPMPTMTNPFRVLADEELPGWLGLPWSPKSWPPSSSSQLGQHPSLAEWGRDGLAPASLTENRLVPAKLEVSHYTNGDQ